MIWVKPQTFHLKKKEQKSEKSPPIWMANQMERDEEWDSAYSLRSITSNSFCTRTYMLITQHKKKQGRQEINFLGRSERSSLTSTSVKKNDRFLLLFIFFLLQLRVVRKHPHSISVIPVFFYTFIPLRNGDSISSFNSPIFFGPEKKTLWSSHWWCFSHFL